MKKVSNGIQKFFPAFGILLLILDSKTAILGASEAISLCIRSVIPSLFPFMMLSILMTSSINSMQFPTFPLIGKICKIPRNAEPLFLVGILSGYPVGAQVVANAYQSGNLSKSNAIRLLGFCNNAGPAFIFGIVGQMFQNHRISWLLWLIHILSAVLVGTFLPQSDNTLFGKACNKTASVQEAFTGSIRIMAGICGWIILFRVWIAILEHWLLWILPECTAVFITGCLELTNGIFALKSIDSEAIRLIFCSVFLALGGICVYMQTLSATGELGTGFYITGKVLQASISCTLSAFFANLIYGPLPTSAACMLISMLISLIMIMILRNHKITVAFLRNCVYTIQKSPRELQSCSFERK